MSAETTTFDRELATRAYAGISWSPELRAAQDEAEYNRHMDELAAHLAPLAETEAQRAVLAAELARYRAGYLRHTHAILSARSGIISPMITGPARFPTARNQRRLDTEQRRVTEFLEWTEAAQRAIKKAIIAARTPEQVEDAAWLRLRRHLAADLAFVHGLDTGTEPQYYDRSAWVTSAIGRIKRAVDNGDIATATKAVAFIREQQADWKKPFITERNAIWRIVAEAAAKQAAPVETTEAAPVAEEEEIASKPGLRAIRNRAIGRLQLFFDGKPDEATRRALKSSGWHWSPTNGAWQRQITANAEYALARFLESR